MTVPNLVWWRCSFRLSCRLDGGKQASKVGYTWHLLKSIESSLVLIGDEEADYRPCLVTEYFEVVLDTGVG